MRTLRSALPRVLAGASLLLAVAAAQADTFTVGTPVGAGHCTHGDLQSAIDDAAINPGHDTIRVTRSVDHTAQALTVNLSAGAGNHLTIEGGYAACTQPEADTTKTVLDGAGGATRPVLRAQVGVGVELRLQRLVLRGGDQNGTGYGGGIHFSGAGQLAVVHSTITGNLAGYGGGIYVEGTGNPPGYALASLRLGEGVEIVGNRARRSGGGIYLENARLYMLEAGSYIALNEASGEDGEGGYGGGLMILASDDGPTVAHVGSGGGFGAIYGNRAVHGGGVAVVASETASDATLVMFGNRPGQRAAIRGNVASGLGGAIHLSPRVRWSGVAGGASAQLWYVDIEDNIAAQGAAINAAHDESLDLSMGGAVYLNADRPDGSQRCPYNEPCSRIRRNASHNGASATDGAVIRATSSTRLLIRRTLIEGNTGGRLFVVDGEGEPLLRLHDSAVIGNQIAHQLFHVRGEDPMLEIGDVTIAGNTIGGPHVFDLGSEVGLRFARSIVWQPGITSLTGGEDVFANYILASEVASFGAGQEAFVADPRFVDPANGDFTLRAASPAVDHAPAIDGDDRDLHDVPRDRDLACVPNLMGPRDLGAWEREFQFPLVLNSHFNAGLTLWSDANGITRHDSTQDYQGAGSGSAHVSQTAPHAVTRAFGASQCIHLPSPGHYMLNGYGRSVGANAQTRDFAKLYWQLRYDGGAQCNAGLFDNADFHSLGRSTSFSRPAMPAAINVPEDRWTPNTSLVVTLVAEEGNTSSGIGDDHAMGAWFDAITLSVNCDVQPPQLRTPMPDRTDPEGALLDWNAAVHFTSPDRGFAWQFTQQGLPPGLSLTQAGHVVGRISHDAAAGSPHTVTIRADDLNGGVAEDSFSWTVTDAEPGSELFRDGFESP